MKAVYFASTLMWSASPEEMTQMALKYGAGGIEVWAQQVESRGYDPEKFAALARQNGIKLIVHAKSWDLNFAALNQGIREASVAEIRECVDLAVRLGADELTVHPPRYTLGESQEARNRAYESICEILSYAGKRNVTISLEIMEHIPKEMATTPEDMRAIILDKEPELTFTVDLAHCLTEQEFWDNIRKMGRVSKVHITNKCGNRLHTPLDQGDFPMEDIFPRLMKCGIPVVIEGYDESGEYEILKRNFNFIQTLKEKEYEKESSIINHNGNFGTYSLQFC